MDGKKIDQLWHEAPEDREAPPAGGCGGSSAGSANEERKPNHDGEIHNIIVTIATFIS